MLPERLNVMLVVHERQELTDSLDLRSIANEFRVTSDYTKTKIQKFRINSRSL